MLPGRAPVDRIARQHRIDAVVEDRVDAALDEVILGALERHVLVADGRADAERSREIAFPAHPHAAAIVVVLEKWILAPDDVGAGLGCG